MSYYLADLGGGSPVTITPVTKPFLQYRYEAASQRTLNTKDGLGNIVPGSWHHYQAGADLTGAQIPLDLDALSESDYASLIAKFNAGESFQYSPDTGTTIYEVVLASETERPERISGSTLFKWKIVLNVVSQLAP